MQKSKDNYKKLCDNLFLIYAILKEEKIQKEVFRELYNQCLFYDINFFENSKVDNKNNQVEKNTFKNLKDNLLKTFNKCNLNFYKQPTIKI